MRLLLDVGNSRIKWALAQDGELVRHGAMDRDTGSADRTLAELLAGLPRPADVWASNVAGDATAQSLSRLSTDLWSLTPVFPRVERERFGLRTGYRDTGQFGVDRWLALIAAWVSYRRAACVAACGTAITIDLTDNEGRHLGGYIIPGLDLMQNGLTAATSGIRERGASVPSAEPGLSTADCLNNGCGLAIAGLIDYNGKHMFDTFGKDAICIITGGAAELIRPLLAYEFKYDPLLVLRGLALLAKGPPA